jgi:hydrogenase-4 component B
MSNETILTTLVVVSLALCGLGALLAVVLPRPRAIILATSATAGLAAFAALASGIAVLAGASPPEISVTSALPLGPLVIRPDALSAFFLIVIGLVSAPVALYSTGYLAAFVGHCDLRVFGALLNLLLLSLLLIALAANGVLFLIAWETMAWLSYLLVNYEHDDPRVIRAGYRMLVVSELGKARG